MSARRRCWCSSEELAPFCEGFVECTTCGTLLSAVLPERDPALVEDEERDLYGERYWTEHQRALGLPTFEERCRDDLPGRCLRWLELFLAHQPPPGPVLEIGAGHGGFVATLRWAGFDATGLELSPRVAARALEAFGVPMLVGPLEHQEISAGSLAAIVTFDVLEHVLDPLATLTRAARLLQPEGLLLLQTPCRPAGATFAELQAGGDPFLGMLIDEHLQLFTGASLAELLRRAGLPAATWEPPPVAPYDQLVVARRIPRPRLDAEALAVQLLESPEGRRVAASLAVRREADRIAEDYLGADRDRWERLARIETLTAELRRGDGERDRLRRSLDEERRAHRQTAQRQAADEERLGRAVAEQQRLEAALAAELDGSIELRAELAEARRASSELGAALTAERQVSAELRAALEAKLAAQTAERQDAEAAAAELSLRLDEERLFREQRELELEEQRSDHACLAAEHDRLIADQAAAARRHDGLRADHVALADDVAVARRELATLAKTHRELRELVADHLQSRVLKAMVACGRWRRFADEGRRLLALPTPPLALQLGDGGEHTSWSFTEVEQPAARDEQAPIAIDLTALRPGGENGGAKLVALELVRQWADDPAVRPLQLLVSSAMIDELTPFASPRVRLRCMPPEPWQWVELLAEPPPALLLCPMTAPPWSDPRCPLVCVVHDLQHRRFPELFSAAERAAREEALRRAADCADRIVAVSEHVRGTVVEELGIAPQRVVTVWNGVADRLQTPEEGALVELLARRGLRCDGYLLYPANSWPHKNHRLLLTAFGQFRHAHPEPSLQLVLTGEDVATDEPLAEAIRGLGLGDVVHHLGFVGDGELSALLEGCRAVIFPSLYEGFGMPVVEAMARGRPVLASAIAALEEVTGGAALTFDPRSPHQLAAAIADIAADDALAAELSRRGRRRAAELGGAQRMAADYRAVLDPLLAEPHTWRDRLEGVYDDGWSGAVVALAHAAGGTLELQLDNPRSAPVTITARVGDVHRQLVVGARSRHHLDCRLPSLGGVLELSIAPLFVPAAEAGSADRRALGVRFLSCRLRTPDGERTLLAEAAV